MKVTFNLENFGIDTTSKKIGDLSLTTLNSILSLIAHKYLYSKTETASISSKHLKSINHEYKKYLEFLKKNEIIMTGNYVVGVHSRIYYFTDFFKKFGKIKTIKSTKNDEKQELIQDYPVGIDNYVVTKLEEDFHSLKFNGTPVKKKLKIDTLDLEVYDFKKYLGSSLNIERLKNNDLYFNWKTGRVYSNFCNCNKETRLNNFMFDNRLMNLDISSSFPMWLSVWCIEKGIDITDIDFIEFVSAIKNQTLYDMLRKKLNKIKDSDGKYYESKKIKKFYSKSETKIEFSKWLNGKEKNTVTNNLMKMYFPSIYDIVDRIKYKMYDELVKLETSFIMNDIVKKLYEQIEGIKIVTCHDEIYFEKRFHPQVQQIWTDEINNIYNKLPIEEEIVEDFDFGILGIEELDF